MGTDGFLNVWKPSGPTSFDIVRRLRRAAGGVPTGHGGTLDPAAEGVLPILVGQATRLSDLLEGCAKAYQARVLLGVQTDTLDLQGQVLARRDPSGVTEQALLEVLPSLTGRILQTPPMFSAVKRGGQPLYRLARRGLEVVRPPRPVTVYRLRLQAWEPPRLTLEIVCGRGTYVRALAATLGENLGCGAALEALVRTRVGPFREEEALRPEEAETALREGSAQRALVPLDALCPGWAALRLHTQALPRALAGALLSAEAGTWGRVPVRPHTEPPFLPDVPEDRAVAYGPDGEFIALLVAEGEGHWRPRKVLASRG